MPTIVASGGACAASGLAPTGTKDRLVPANTSARDGYMPSAEPASLGAYAAVLGVVAGPALTMSVQARRSADGDHARSG